METRFSGVLKFVTTYSYHNDLNKANWDYNHSGLSCFFGQASKHLIKQSRTQNIDAGTTSETEWTYELNSKGLPEKMTILFVNLGSFSTYYYSYECE